VALFATGLLSVSRFGESSDGPSLAIGARMARRNRLKFPGAVYHVMSRGNRKLAVVNDDVDRHTFMSIFSDAAQDSGVRVYASCLMDTHYHAVLDTPRSNLSDFIRTLNSEYSTAFNRRHAHIGHTFEQRFHSVVVQREKYLRRVARYVALNPVKARLCRDAGEWEWGTHRALAGLDDAPPWLHVGWLCWAFRAEAQLEAQHRYQEYVKDPAGLAWSFDATDALGTVRFKRSIRESLAQDRPIPKECRGGAPPPLNHVFSGRESDCRRRDALILIAHRTHGYRLVEIAKFLGVAPSTVSKALKRAKVKGGVGR
jgi:putative transposase